MKLYLVTFRWGADNDIYCANLCRAESADAAWLYYERRYDVVNVRECNPVEAESYIGRGMPLTVAQ